MTKTPTTESSLLFSLDELMSVEQDRIDTEQHQQRQALLEAERDKAQAIANAQTAERARQRAEEQRRNDARMRRREDDVRSQATREAEIERVRIEAARRGELELKKASWEHELKIKTLEQDDVKKQLRATQIASAAMLAIAAAVCGFIVNNLSADHRIDRTALRAEILEGDAKLAELQRSADQQEGAIAQLETELDAANARADDAEKKAQQAANETAAATPRPTLSGFRPATPQVRPPAIDAHDGFSISDCKPGDPDPACGNLDI